jgi:hypothetical protein
MKNIWDFVQNVWKHNDQGIIKWISVLGDCKFIPFLDITIVSQDNYYKVCFESESVKRPPGSGSKTIIEFKIEKEYSLFQSGSDWMQSRYKLSGVSVDGLYLPGSEDTLLEFINIRLAPYMREFKLREIGIYE